MQSVSPEANTGRATANLEPPVVSAVQPSWGVRRPERALLKAESTSVQNRLKGIGTSLTRLITKIIILLIIIQICPTICVLASQSTPVQSLNIYSINANGMGSVLKVNTISTNINRRDPHVFVISETKSTLRQSGKLQLRSPKYRVIENTGQPTGKTPKWGIVMGISKDIAMARQEVMIPGSLEERAIAADLILPTDSGGSWEHRIIGVYAPSSNYSTESITTFWNDVAGLCRSAPATWTIIGDANISMTGQERSSGKTVGRAEFASFLQDARGRDVWMENPDRNWTEDWTVKKGEGCAIIDRLVVSIDGVSIAKVETIKDEFTPGTDHRPIWGTIIPNVTQGMSSVLESLRILPRRLLPDNARIRYPAKNEREKFVKFAEKVD